jgi:hypothetical protein
MELADGSTDIVHPEVRAHITSLVSAVSLPLKSNNVWKVNLLTLNYSLEVSVPTTMVATNSETMPSRFCVILNDGFDSTMKRRTAWMLPDASTKRI